MSHAPIHTVTTRLAAAAVISLSLVACGGDSDADSSVVDMAAPTAASVDALPTAYGLVTPQQAAAIATSGVTVIDVRTPEEFAEGHIDGAVMIDFYGESFADDIGALDPDGEYLIYCRSGSRSGQALSLMETLGFEQVYDLDGGVIAYDAQGLPLVP